MSGPLTGISVIELSRYIAAPVTGKTLGELGADVIKIEDPDRGDPMRYWQSGDREHSPQFAAYNRTKRGMTLDLKLDAGREIFLRLADGADVVVENFRPGVMDRLGIGWSVLEPRNSRLVYASITGFGTTGPYADRPAYDTVISAMSALFSQIMDPARPQPMGPAFSDVLSGTYAALGIIAALYARESTGRGQYVDTTMLRAVLGFLVESGSTFLDQGEATDSTTRQRRAQSYGLVSSDGAPFVIHMSVPEKFWIAATDAFGLAELRSDPRFIDRQARHDNYFELDALLKTAAATRTLSAWFEILEAADLPHGRINGFDTVFDDPQVRELGIVETIGMPDGQRPLTQVGAPFSLSDTPLRVAPPAPTLGQDTVAILDELGYTGEEVDHLRRSGVIS
ncbi:MAG: CoA transferase [Acidimicrobiia bacterium]|nr:CoA transferase [Acidimicrobiia bacterium]